MSAQNSFHEELPRLNAGSLSHWFNKSDMIAHCVTQVQKDLSAYGIVLSWSGQTATAYRELFTQLQPQIANMMARGTKLHAMLYRVDIPESEISKAMQGDEPLEDAVTRLILWRELQKVVTRFIMSRSS